MTARYGCHGRPPYVAERIVKDGAYEYSLTPKIVSIPNFSHGAACQFTRSDLGRVDPRCDGCSWKSTEGKKHD